MDELTTFLRQQTVMQIAPKAPEPWIANVLMACEEPAKLFFVGSSDRLYGKLLRQYHQLAFATAWHQADDRTNRKGIQGVGTARMATADDEITLGVALHNRDYPEFTTYITKSAVCDERNSTCVWVIEPQFIKFWNDELYGPEGSEFFRFST